MGCDGIYEVKSNQEIIDMVTARAAKKTLKLTAEDILDGLLAPTTQSIDCPILDVFGLDNMTLLIIKMKN
jgi:serine/threonine protein phosphatase PrpC